MSDIQVAAYRLKSYNSCCCYQAFICISTRYRSCFYEMLTNKIPKHFPMDFLNFYLKCCNLTETFNIKLRNYFLLPQREILPKLSRISLMWTVCCHILKYAVQIREYTRPYSVIFHDVCNIITFISDLEFIQFSNLKMNSMQYFIF